MPTPYNFDIIASSENSLTGFDNTPSINDSGLVAFVGNLNGAEDLFVGDASNPITNLSTSPLATQSFFSGIEINNDNQIVAVNSGAIRLWDADNPGLHRRTIGTAAFGNEFTDFDNIFPFASINNVTPPQSNDSEVVFNADPKDGFSSAVGLHTYRLFGGENTYFEGPLANSIGIPMLADNGRVVSQVDNSTIRVFNYGLNQNQIIASDASVGRAPGISDNGQAVAFYGDNGGEGIFISIETDSGWERHRIAGVVGNGVLDPGETYEDTNNNGSFDPGEEENGLIGSFSPFDRIGINYSETEDGGFGTVTYLARDESGNESLISSQFNISDSSPEPGVSHSLVAKVGEPANQLDAGLTGNIQDLNIYDPINNPGQIAFWAETTTGAEAVVRANPIRKPVFIVPGIVGSLPSNEDVNEWLTNRGFAPDRLQPEQISNIYDDLVETLKRSGYVEGVDLFVATYDWQLNPAPIDGTIDGVINRSVGDLTDDTYEYSVDQFAFWLQESITGWKSQFSDLPESEIPELDSVDVIAHSAGGATVRSYIQSDGYGQVFDDNGTKLPEIDNFISLGVPYRGASVAWNGLNNNFNGGAVLQLAKLISKAAYAKARNGSTISLSGQNDVPEAITPQEVNTGTVEEFIEDYVPHLRALLATYPFIQDSSGSLRKAEELDPQSRNELLLDLNDGFDSINNEGGGNPTQFADKIGQLAVVFGSGIAANDAVLQRTGPDFETVPGTIAELTLPVRSIATLDRGRVAPEIDEIWYENLPAGTADLNEQEDPTIQDGQGDGTVPLLSATGFFSEETNNPNFRNNILFQDFPSVTHNQQPFDLEVQQYILDVLQVDLEEDLISTNLNETSNPDIPGLAFDAITFGGEFILDPVEGFLVDNQGRRLGYTSATGAVTEIPNSYWLGEEDGVGFFTEPVEGPFQLELTGLGEEYYVSVEVETDEGAAGIELEGFLDVGEQIVVDVPLIEEPQTSLDDMAEYGVVDNLTDAVQTIELERDFINPVVFVQPLSNNESETAAVRLQDITENSFSLSIQEPSNQDGLHAPEQVSYFVLEAGTWRLPNGELLQVGTTSSDQLISQEFQSINFSAEFNDTPALFTQVQTNNDPDFVQTRQRNISNQGFEFGLEEQESTQDSTHGLEQLGWFAIEQGSGTWGLAEYQAGNTGDRITDSFQDIDFTSDFISAPQFLASLSSYDGIDPAGVRYQNLAADGVEVRVAEDTSLDSETSHTTDEISFLAIAGSGLLSAEPITNVPILANTDLANDEEEATEQLSLNLSSPAAGETGELFIFDNPNQEVEIIADFSTTEDTLVFSSAGFEGDLTPGEVSSDMFTLGAAATTEAHRFIYNGANGQFFYDRDGIGDQAQIQIARLQSGLNLSSDNLLVN